MLGAASLDAVAITGASFESDGDRSRIASEIVMPRIPQMPIAPRIIGQRRRRIGSSYIDVSESQCPRRSTLS